MTFPRTILASVVWTTPTTCCLLPVCLLCCSPLWTVPLDRTIHFCAVVVCHPFWCDWWPIGLVREVCCIHPSRREVCTLQRPNLRPDQIALRCRMALCGGRVILSTEESRIHPKCQMALCDGRVIRPTEESQIHPKCIVCARFSALRANLKSGCVNGFGVWWDGGKVYHAGVCGMCPQCIFRKCRLTQTVRTPPFWRICLPWFPWSPKKRTTMQIGLRKVPLTTMTCATMFGFFLRGSLCRLRLPGRTRTAATYQQLQRS